MPRWRPCGGNPPARASDVPTRAAVTLASLGVRHPGNRSGGRAPPERAASAGVWHLPRLHELVEGFAAHQGIHFEIGFTHHPGEFFEHEEIGAMPHQTDPILAS